MKYWDILIDTPNYEQWVFGVPGEEPPTWYRGCFVLEAEESEPDFEDECGGNVEYE